MKVKALTDIFYNGVRVPKGVEFDYKGNKINTAIMEEVKEKETKETKPKKPKKETKEEK